MNKADTLLKLEENLESAMVLPQITLSLEDLSNEEQLKNLILSRFEKENRFIVRSCHSEEDLENNSQAGKYLSMIDIGISEIKYAAEKVLKSYGNSKFPERVLIQPYLSNAKRVGVIFTHEPNTGAPYFIDNYSLNSDTTLITSGSIKGFTRKCISYNRDHSCDDIYCARLNKIIAECQEILGFNNLDVEYAIDEASNIYVFQARHLRIPNTPQDATNIENQLDGIKDFLSQKQVRDPFLAGRKTIFAVMPDWNPAEMIGRKPKQLALSLYRELITDSIWAYQRDNYGYKTLRSFPLLVEIGHQPFIDVRVSFNSLMPKGLESSTEEKLIDFYISKLENDKKLHDKVEFEIVLSSWTFDLESKLKNLPGNISQEEKFNIKNSLINLTHEIYNGDFLKQDIDRVKNLDSRRERILSESNNSIALVYWLLEDCKRWGTLPFAGLARGAFISTQIIKSLENVSGHDRLLLALTENVNSITSQMSQDYRNLSRQEFLKKYGHLRPGTYDVSTPTYNQAFDQYFQNSNKSDVSKIHHSEKLIEELLDEFGLEKSLGINPKEFLKRSKDYIFWREQAKFEFTKNLSIILETLVSIGKEFGFSRSNLVYADIKDFISLYSTHRDMKKSIGESINRGKHLYGISSSIELPSVIICSDDVYCFTEEDATANFVTKGKVSGSPSSNLSRIENKIVLIEGADPGFDWIFQHKILGLITAYGGANSHMSIRCSELAIPAAIGVGERVFHEIENSNFVLLDCNNKIIEYK